MNKTQFRFLYLWMPFLFLLGCATETTKQQPADDQPRRIELLFLGHASEHHNSRAYFPILASALTKEGINITYTENVEDLNSDKLNLYDGLIVYANHENITSIQETALLDFVAEGNAFIPIHSASFCFQNSPDYINLVGAQFMKHGTGTFQTSIVQKEHPTMQGLEEFSTWDETYEHDKIAKDIDILMERVEDGHREPWTWVKQHGKGKIFYTAYGHDERTWNNPGFLQLIKQGILWAVADNVKKNWAAFSKDIPTLTYEDRTGIPNYEKRDPAPKYQLPLSPEASAKLIQVPAGFDLQLFAAEPDIINPIAMNWDERGRLWVIETVDYPNTVREEEGIGDDRVKILEDTDGDGKADKVTVFAEKLNIPTSFAFYDGGIVVSQAPHFLFLKDTNGDDKADIREIMIDGWGVSDTHAGPSNLQNGIDNNIYGVVGYSGFEGNIYEQPFDFSQNVYRFHPKKKYFEVLTNTSNNTWGLGITEDNAIFASTANNEHSVFLGIPNAAMEGVEGIPAKGSIKIDGHYDMQPITRNYRQVDVFGGFTAAAGHYFYTARTYPSSYWNKVAFVCEPTGNLVHTAKIEKNGAGYIEKDGGNLFASSDEWVSPVEARVGPDGNVWVADWYNFIVQHNPTPSESFGGFKGERGDGNAYVNPLRDKSRGRIWRVIPKNATTQNTLVLNKEKPEELLKALSHKNMFWRMTAQRLLVERENTDVLKSLYELVQNTNVDDLGMNPSALHALWTIEGLGGLDYFDAKEVVKNALNHPAAAVRRAAIQIMPKNQANDEAIKQAKALHDADAAVRLATLLYFTERPASKAMGQSLYELSKEKSVIEDNWLSKAVYAAANKHSSGFMEQYLAENPNSIAATTPKLKRQATTYDDTAWDTMELPQLIENAGLQMDGIIWFRKDFTISSTGSTEISLGPIDDSDITYINGQQIGVTEQEYAKNRFYTIPKNVLKKGQNTIAIRVEDTGGGGGIYGESNQLYIKDGKKKISLAGNWKYEVETDFTANATNPFDGTSIAAVFAKHYDKVAIEDKAASTSPTDQGTVITMKTIQNEMKYDLKEFTVKAGSTVTLVFENNDFMQHNLLILKKGSLEKVGKAADEMVSDPTAGDKNYVPNMPEVLHATELVNPKEKATLQFTAPDKPGEYPYVCTFPGHWRIMQGVMNVVE